MADQHRRTADRTTDHGWVLHNAPVSPGGTVTVADRAGGIIGVLPGARFERLRRAAEAQRLADGHALPRMFVIPFTELASGPAQAGELRDELLAGRPGSFVWDSQEAVAYEVAMEAVHRALGALRVALELPVVRNDPAETDRLQRERDAAIAAISVDPTDTARVREVTTHFNQLAAGLPRPAVSWT